MVILFTFVSLKQGIEVRASERYILNVTKHGKIGVKVEWQKTKVEDKTE